MRLLAMLVVAVAACGSPEPRGAASAVVHYTCSMDPSVEADRPGSCPICGMALTPVTAEDRASGAVKLSTADRVRLGLRVASVEQKPMGRRVVASGEVIEGAAPGRMWIEARVYRGTAADVHDVRPGRAATVSTPEQPLTLLAGTAIPPIDHGAGRMRIDADNPDDVLRPGALVEVAFEIALEPRLAIPVDAVIHAGARQIVFVERPGGRFEPRTPRLGAQFAGAVEVLDGLALGDRVVIAGTFLLAAEHRIRSDGALWSGTP